MTILDTIVEHTRQVLDRRRRDSSLYELEQRTLFADSRRDFLSALAAERISVIAEIKKASPSKGVIRDDFDPRRLAAEYEAAGASAISVLTEEAFFQGSLNDLSDVRSETSLPLLRKDFIVDPYQIFEARAAGADAILLIATILEPDQLHELHAAAAELELAALVEIYDPRELDRLDVDALRIVGVNNRDLRTFDVDISRSTTILRSLPRQIVRVSESGIENGADLAELASNEIDAALVGETLMKAPSPGDRLREMFDEMEQTLQN